MSYIPTIGLEIHAELKTRTKMFCNSANDSEEKIPNGNVCPVCLAHPGTLPVINQEAVRQVLRIGAALSGTLADYTEFDRKSYFYPDIPKGYQISQYEHPLVRGGALLGIAITRIHLEEDTARSTHKEDHSVIDFNRAGVPLMELVTEPVIHDAKTAGDFARELQLLLRTLGAGDANLEKGEMRIEANVSVSNTDTLGTKVEIKNLNSFRSVERAIAYEIDRQTEVLKKGETLTQETRGWDEIRQVSFHQRSKEGSADYRYFPDPDLPKLLISELPEFTLETLRASLPELPWERKERYESLGVKKTDAVYLSSTTERMNFFDAVLRHVSQDSESIQRAANYVVSDLAGWYAKHGGIEYERISPESFSRVMNLVGEGTLSSRGAKDILALLAEKGGDADSHIQKEGYMQVNDPEKIERVVREVLIEQKDVANDFKKGKDTALQYLIGQVMKRTKGSTNPQTIREVLLRQLGI